MKLLAPLAGVLALVAWHLTASIASAENQAFDVGVHSQVFIDRALVANADGVTFKLVPARKHPDGVWLDHDRSRTPPAGPMVIYDAEKKLFTSWSAAGYNSSTDGLNWATKEKNPDSWDAIRRVAVIDDNRDPDPTRRYKLLTFGPGPEASAKHPQQRLASLPESTLWYLLGYHTFTSPDGRELSHLSRESILLDPGTGRAPGDMVNASFQPRLGLYAAFVKMTAPDSRFTKRRSFAVLTSKDFVRWSKPNLAFVADEADDARAMARLDAVRPLLLTTTDPQRLATHVYGIGGTIELESCTLALMRLFTVHGATNDGPSEVQLAVSRDLQRWERPFREPVIRPGKVGSDFATSDWDSCWFNHEGPGVSVGDEIWVYYSARNTPHDHPVGFNANSFKPEQVAAARKQIGSHYRSGMGIAVWKRDRFVSVDAGNNEGSLTTIPITFRGSALELNAATQHGGEITVEMRNSDGKTMARSQPVSGDRINHTVIWESGFEPASAVGQPVVLHFRLRSASLFAFAFRNGSTKR